MMTVICCGLQSGSGCGFSVARKREVPTRCRDFRGPSVYRKEEIQNCAMIAKANLNASTNGQRCNVCRLLLHKGHTRQPADRHVTDVVGRCDRGQRLALGNPRQSFDLLMFSELGLPSKSYTPCLRTNPALFGSAQDQMAFELGQPSKHSQHQPAVRRRGIRPRITQRLEARSSFADRR